MFSVPHLRRPLTCFEYVVLYAVFHYKGSITCNVIALEIGLWGWQCCSNVSKRKVRCCSKIFSLAFCILFDKWEHVITDSEGMAENLIYRLQTNLSHLQFHVSNRNLNVSFHLFMLTFFQCFKEEKYLAVWKFLIAPFCLPDKTKTKTKILSNQTR